MSGESAAPADGPGLSRFTPLACAALAFALYAVTITRGLAWDDAAELAAGVVRLGSVHAIGYPVYLLLGRVFVAVLPFGSAAEQANLWSAAGGAAAVGLVALYVMRSGGSVAGAAVAAVALATGSIFWEHSTAASVYPFELIALLALLFAAGAWERQRTAGRLAWLMAAIGLIAISHRTALAFAVAGLGFVVWRGRATLWQSGNRLALLAVIVPLTTAVYVPVRTSQVAYPNTPKLFRMTAWQTLNGGPRRVAPEAAPLQAGPAELVRHAVKTAFLVPSQLSFLALALVPFGLARRRRDLVLMALGLAPALVVSATVLTTHGAFSYWHLPLLLVGTILAGAGVTPALAWLRGRTPLARAALAGAAAVALLTGPVLGAAYVHGHRQNASPWARSLLARLPSGADVLAPWAAYQPLRATQALERRRRDVRLVYSPHFLRDSTSLRGVRERYLVTVSEAPVAPPPGLTLTPVAGPARVQGKGVAGLRLGPVPLAEKVQIARVYRVAGGHRG